MTKRACEAKWVRTDKMKKQRSKLAQFNRATQHSLSPEHRWMLETSASFETVLDAASTSSASIDQGLSPVKARVSAAGKTPDDAIVQLEGEVSGGSLTSMPSAWLYCRMCEFEALRGTCENAVAKIFLELRRRGDFLEPVSVSENESSENESDTEFYSASGWIHIARLRKDELESQQLRRDLRLPCIVGLGGHPRKTQKQAQGPSATADSEPCYGWLWERIFLGGGYHMKCRKAIVDAAQPPPKKSQRVAPAEKNSNGPNLNKQFTMDFEEHITQLFDKYPNLEEMPALSVTEGGSGARFSQEACSQALSMGAMFRFNGSIFLHDIRYRPWPTLPVNRASILEQLETHYNNGPPEAVPFDITVATEGMDDDLMSLQGKLKRLSPEEPVFALLYAAAMAETEEDIQAYQRLLLNVHYKVVSRAANADLAKESISLREKMTDDVRAIKRTPLSMMLFMVEKKKEIKGPAGKVTTEKVYQYFKGCHWSKESEAPSLGFLENCFSLWNKIEAAPGILDTIQRAEMEFNQDSPFSSVQQMYHITLACKKVPPAKLAWVFEGILDGARAQILSKDDITKSRLSGAEKVNPVHVIAFKYDLLQELLHTELAKLDITPQDAASVRDKLQKDVAVWLGNCYTFFLGGFNVSGSQGSFVDLVDHIIFSKLHDTCIRSCVKLSKVPADALLYGSIGVAVGNLQKMQEQLRTEAKAEAAAQLKCMTDQEQPSVTPLADGESEEGVKPIAGQEDETADMDDEMAEAWARWKAKAVDKVRRHVELLVRPSNSSSEEMYQMFRDCATYKLPLPSDKHYHMHVYDCKTEGECKTRPHVRKPVHRPTYMLAAVQACLKARCQEEDDDAMYVTNESLYCFFDACKHEHIQTFEKAFSTENNRCHDIDMDVVEHACLMTLDPLAVESRKRLFFSKDTSSNKFNHLGPVTLEDINDDKVEWLLPVVEKREILGDTRKEGSGPCPLGGGEGLGGGRKALTDVEPVAWHGNSVNFWREMVHGYWAGTATDLTPQNENFAVACICHGVPYVALCNNAIHKTKLYDRIVKRVLNLMGDENCPALYESVMVADLAKKEKEEEGTEKNKGRGRGRGKGRSKGKRGKGKQGAGAGEDGAEGQGGQGEGEGEGEGEGDEGEGAGSKPKCGGGRGKGRRGKGAGRFALNLKKKLVSGETGVANPGLSVSTRNPTDE
ncbi:unnamed protein product [Symbiodinium sp. CCMP2456]|nr:unnamed protein product [Symbiodinium sp. CCMP2456]